MHEQDKQECTYKTAAKQAVHGSGRVRGGTMLWDDGEGDVAWSGGSAWWRGRTCIGRSARKGMPRVRLGASMVHRLRRTARAVVV